MKRQEEEDEDAAGHKRGSFSWELGWETFMGRRGS